MDLLMGFLGFIVAIIMIIFIAACCSGIKEPEQQMDSAIEDAKKFASTQSSEENRKKLPSLKAQFLSRNGAFPKKIVDEVLCHRSEFPWIVTPNKFLQKTVTVFLGYGDLYVIEGAPRAEKYKFDDGYSGEEGRLWPHTTYSTGWVSHGTYRTHDYKNLRLTYFQLGFANIAPYSDAAIGAKATKEDVLRWITEDVRSKFRSRHPEFTVSQVEISKEIKGTNAYCYFTYETSASQATGWK